MLYPFFGQTNSKRKELFERKEKWSSISVALIINISAEKTH